VFIAMVLVAAIAAGVLLNTAGFLQTKSKATGQGATAQVSDRVFVASMMGNVTNRRIDFVNLTVMRGAGAKNINLTTATLAWIGPKYGKTLSYVNGSADSKHFAVKPLKDPDNSSPVLDETSDRFRVIINASSIDGGLRGGDSFTVKFATSSGAVTYKASIPQVLLKQQAVSL